MSNPFYLYPGSWLCHTNLLTYLSFWPGYQIITLHWHVYDIEAWYCTPTLPTTGKVFPKFRKEENITIINFYFDLFNTLYWVFLVSPYLGLTIYFLNWPIGTSSALTLKMLILCFSYSIVYFSFVLVSRNWPKTTIAAIWKFSLFSKETNLWCRLCAARSDVLTDARFYSVHLPFNEILFSVLFIDQGIDWLPPGISTFAVSAQEISFLRLSKVLFNILILILFE